MPNQELLELAAYAADFRNVKYIDDKVGLIVTKDDGSEFKWNPLDDDQDAFRLMVYLDLNVKFSCCDDDTPIVTAERFDCDVTIPNFPCSYTTTRKAIVLAAVKAAKTMTHFLEAAQ